MAATQPSNEAPIPPVPVNGQPSIMEVIQQLNSMPPDARDQYLSNFPDIQNLVKNKETAAETLSNLSQQHFLGALSHALQSQAPFQPAGVPAVHGISQPISDPGPSSHPHGPPDLSQSAAVASAIVGAAQSAAAAAEEAEDDKDDGDQENDQHASSAPPPRTRGARTANMGSEEWARQRKDNHKEVERRRRGNINEGITELGRIVPNGSGEKAKGAILSRAVQYIHHLKENEARNIEKWTLEKLLMDQAMGDLQSQLDEMRRMWEEERTARTRAEGELELLRGLQMRGGQIENGKEGADKGSAGEKEGEGLAQQAEAEAARLGKRQRVE